jgi:hypothetical protein
MKHVSTFLGAGAFLLALVAMSFTVKHTPVTPSTPSSSKPATQKARDIYYYFYDVNDNYVDYNTATDETYRLENLYYVYVDQNSEGADLLENGYVMPGKPHTGWVDVFLYGHFGFLTNSKANHPATLQMHHH